MKILLLAPHPYYQERGTPIDVELVVRVLSGRGDFVDLLAYHEGEDREYKNVTIYRSKPWIPIHNIKPNFSLKKILCDFFMFVSAIQLVRKNKYALIHAGEESVFMALLISVCTGIPFVYDMDSILSRQITDHFPHFRCMRFLFEFMESIPIKYAKMVFPVCDSIAEHAKKHGARSVYPFYDIAPDIPNSDFSRSEMEDIRKTYGIEGEVIMYIGNLAYNQGIDLLLESFQALRTADCTASLVIIGGLASDIAYYKEKAQELGIENNTYFIGPRPFTHVYHYLKQADIVVSSRTKGNNIPMKVYTYLHSGVPLLVTDIYSHTQAITADIAYIAKPNKNDFSEGMRVLLNDKHCCEEMVCRAKEFIRARHTFSVFKQRALTAFNELEEKIISL